jgi:hypothetical protein
MTIEETHIMTYKRFTKHIVVFITIMIMFTSLGYSHQVRENSLSFSCGLVTLDQVSSLLTDILTVVVTTGTYTKEYTQYSPAMFLTYHNSSKGRFEFGGTVGRYVSKGNLTASGGKEWTFKESSTIVAVEADYKWITKNSFQLYSGLGFGARFRYGTYGVDKPTNKIFPAFHVNLLGFRLGGQFGIFGDIGVGYKGVFNMGINYQF